MKILILFFSLNLMASNWMTPEDIQKAKDGVYPITAYTYNHGGMYQIDNCDPTICTIQTVEVDDIDKPIYSKENVQECEDEYLCLEQIKPVCEMSVFNEDKEPYEICHDYCEEYPGTTAYVNELYTESYCSSFPNPIGYKKKIVKQLREDAVLKAAKEARLAAKAQAKIDKENKKLQLETSIDTCLNLDPNTAKAKDAINCILPLIKYIRDHK